MHINSLPPLVFSLIFSRLSLQDLLLVGRVCTLWKFYQVDTARRVHSITLFIGVPSYYEAPGWTYYITPQDLMAQSHFTLPHSNELRNEEGRPLFGAQSQGSLTSPYLYTSIMNQLVDCGLANIRTLNIFITGVHCYVIERLFWLLAKWKPKHLVSFGLWAHFSRDHPNDPIWYATPKAMLMPKLIESLNSLSALEHVTFSGSPISDDSDVLSILLSRIHEFNYSYKSSRQANLIMSQVPQWLTQNGNNPQLERIGLGGIDDVRQLASTTFAAKITVLQKIRLVEDFILNHLKAFTSLTSLEVNLSSLPGYIKSISTYLSNLIHLRLRLNSSLTAFNGDIPTHKLTQLPSVKLLSLDASITGHKNLASPHWAWIFPNVQIVCVEDCHISGLYNSKDSMSAHLHQVVTLNTEPRGPLSDGMLALVATFKHCPSLRRIYLNDQLPRNRATSAFVNFCINIFL